MVPILFCHLTSVVMFFLYYLLVLHCMIISISRQVKKFILKLMTRNMTFVTWLINQWTLLGNNKRDALIVLFDEYIFLSLATRVFFSGKKLYWFFFLFITNKSFSPDTYYKTTSWINSTVFDSFLGKDWQYTLSSTEILMMYQNVSPCHIFCWDSSSAIALILFSYSASMYSSFEHLLFYVSRLFLLTLRSLIDGRWGVVGVGGEAGILGRGVGKNWKF